MNWDQDAINKLLAVPTPDLSTPPPVIDKDEPGLQDATVSDAAAIAPLVGAAPIAEDVASSVPGVLASKSGQLRLGGDLNSLGDKVVAARKAGMYSPSDVSTSAMPNSDLNALGDKIKALRDGKAAAEAATAKAQAMRWLEQKDFMTKTFGKGYADGGPVVQDSTLEGLARLLKQAHGNPVEGSSDTPKGYAPGGPVTPEDDSDDSDGSEDDSDAPAAPQGVDPAKLAAVMAAMGLPQVSGGDTPVSNFGAPQGATPTVTAPTLPPPPAALPAGPGVISTPGGTPFDTPAPAPVPPPVAPPVQQAPVPPPAKSPVNVPTAPPTPPPAANPGTGPVANMLTTMTGGDPDKLQAVLSQLKDQQTRGQFAKALAIIGDTFGNVGLARAGRDPQGFKGTALVDQNNKDTQGNLVDNLKTQLANDPNSQTSKFAQQAAATILGIKPGDPRAAGLAKAPAAVLSTQLPPLADSVKTQLDREAQAIQSKQFEQSKAMQAQQILQQQKDREAQLALGQMGAETAREHEKTEAAGSALEHLSPLNPLNWGALAGARNTVSGTVGPPQQPAPVQTVTYQGKQYSKINGQWVAH